MSQIELSKEYIPVYALDQRGEKICSGKNFFYYMILLHRNLVQVTAQPLLKSSLNVKYEECCVVQYDIDP